MKSPQPVRGTALLLALCATAALAEPPQISLADYRHQITQAQSLLADCTANAAHCDPKALPQTTEQIGSANIDWTWLRESIAAAHDPKLADRGTLLAAAADRLQLEAQESGVPPNTTDARTHTNTILHNVEFGQVQQQSWWQEKLAALGLILTAFFTRAGDLMPRSPWFGELIEWGLLGLAAAGLLLWALRVSRQQRLMVTAELTSAEPIWQKESDDWAARAGAEAARADWREAVHCLYWSAIVMLEGQRLWRQNRARTPREYVRLLEPGTPRQRALGGLTGVFERIWYGLRPAAQHDYDQALALLEQLRAG